MERRTIWSGFAALVAAAIGTVAGAAVITPGNIVVYRVGDGTAAIGTTATAVFLDEYSPAGTLMQSIALPTTGASSLTAVGNATTEGIISPSGDGTALVFTGYRKDVGGTSPAGDAYSTTARVVGLVTLAGMPDTSTTLINDNGSTAANTIRSAVTATSTPGSVIWTSTSSRIGFDATGLGGAGGTTQIDARNSRQIQVVDDVVYASNGSTAVSAKVQSYGTLPTSATSPTAIATLASTDAVNGFFFADLNPLVAGVDTLYANSTVEGLLRKFAFDGTTWTAAGSISSNAINVAGVVNGSDVTLYLSTGSALQTLTDSSGIGGTLTGTPSTIASAGTNTAFRGLGVLVVPEPASLGLLATAGVALVARRRK